jgi:hypothetical protein
MSAYASATDYFTRLQLRALLGPLGVEAVRALVEERAGARPDPRSDEEWEDAVHSNRGDRWKTRAPNFPITETRVERKSQCSPRDDVKLRRERSTFAISLTHATRKTIKDELYRVAPHGVESGGLLLGHYANTSDGALVVIATGGPAPGAQHSRDEVNLGRVRDMIDTLPDFLHPDDLFTVVEPARIREL